MRTARVRVGPSPCARAGQGRANCPGMPRRITTDGRDRHKGASDAFQFLEKLTDCGGVELGPAVVSSPVATATVSMLLATEAVRMLEMTEAEVGGFLDRQEVGVLASCTDGAAYGTPESFGYRDGRLYFLLELPPDSRKRAFPESTDTVCFTVYAADSPRDFGSVIVRGTMRALSDSSEADLAVASNDQFPPEHVFSDRDGIEEYELVAEELTGRKGPAFPVESGRPPVVAGDD